MDKEEWINKANDYYFKQVGFRDEVYMESLYVSMADDGFENDPEAAVEEDMGYWD